MKRIAIVGTSGSGKTTFAANLARALGVRHIELDQMRWNPDWALKPVEEFVGLVETAIRDDAWVVDGNYSRLRPVIWQRADTLVWLDYRFHVVLGRLLRRTMRRVVLGEECCNGNRERLSNALSKDSIILWMLQTYGRRRREYPQLMADPQYAHLQKLRFATPKEAAAWLEQFSQNG
jgi:adenylate kinase family enzyme